MNIEEAIDILKNSIADYVIGEYCEKCADNKICDDRNEDCYYQQAIDTVITAYEKEKEKNKELSNSYDKLAKECNEENRRCMLLAVENQDLKEKNEYLPSWVGKKYISKDKIKAKIEELEKLDFGTDSVLQFTANLQTITILQSLLGSRV